MRKRILAVLMACTMSVVALAGCGKKGDNSAGDITVDEIIDGWAAYEIDSASADVDMDLAVDLKIQGQDMSVALGGKMKTEYENLSKPEEMKMYADGDIDINLMGMKQTQNTEMYILMEDGKEKMYMSNPENPGEWYLIEQAIEDEMMDMLINRDENKDEMFDIYRGATLEKNTKKYGGCESYVLKMTITGDEMNKFLEDALEKQGLTMDEIMKEAGEMEFDLEAVLDCISMDVVMGIAKDDFHPTYFSIDLTKTDIEGILEAIGGADQAGIPADSFALKSLVFTMELSDVNKTTVEVPQDVIDNAITDAGVEKTF